MKPIIGVMPLWDDEKESIWMLPGYVDGILQAGGLPVILPFAGEEDLDRLTEMCDGFLFTGGHDVSPRLYGEEPLEGLVCCCEKRDEMEKGILDRALDTGKPVLGICRGIQFINAALGGTLYQDLPSQFCSPIDHHQAPPYDVPCHGVEIKQGTPLSECLGVKALLVNSYHHQAVKKLAPGLKPMASSPDCLTEALYMPEHPFLWAVQWHPEFSFRSDPSSQRIFRAFTEAAGQ